MQKSIVPILDFQFKFEQIFVESMTQGESTLAGVRKFMEQLLARYTPEALILFAADRGSYRSLFRPEKLSLGSKSFECFYDLCAFLSLRAAVGGADLQDLAFTTPLDSYGQLGDVAASVSIPYRRWRRLVGLDYIPFSTKLIAATFDNLSNCPRRDRSVRTVDLTRLEDQVQKLLQGEALIEVAALRRRLVKLQEQLDKADLNDAEHARGMSLVEGILHESCVLIATSYQLKTRYEKVKAGKRDIYWFANEIGQRFPIPTSAIADRLVTLGFILQLGCVDVHTEHRAQALAMYKSGLETARQHKTPTR